MSNILVDGIEYRAVNHLYAVSRCGKALRNGHPYLPVVGVDGYPTLGRETRLHRAVAMCWLETFAPKKHIHHINGNKLDNRVENLECLTAQEHHGSRHFELHSVSGRYVRTEATKEKLRQARLGSVTSEETKAKQRAALLGRTRPNFPRAGHSEESKAKRSLEHPRNTACKVFGVVYRSFAEAAKATGIHRFTLRKRCLSDNFPDYELHS